jgi:formylglycine-generating enzyme required for sulfatase activity
MNRRFVVFQILALFFLYLSISSCDKDNSCVQPDATPPGRIIDLSSIAKSDSSITLTWTPPGDDGSEGTSAAYDLRYSTIPDSTPNWWDSVSVAAALQPVVGSGGMADTFAVRSLSAATEYYFALKAADESENWSEMSNVCVDTTLAASDQIPPAAIVDLAVTAVTDSSVSLAWTAPGDDGSDGRAARYDIRYFTSIISDGNFQDAFLVSDPPEPQSAGNGENVVVTALTPGTIYYFALIAIDDGDNQSGLSNVASDTTSISVDQIPPAAVADLTAAAVTDSTVTLTWTASGDDGDEGTAFRYDLRYSETELSAETWSAATRVSGLSAPQIAGSMESVTVDSLIADTIYYFALITLDDADNHSGLSNVASDTTSVSTDQIPPAAVTDLSAAAVTDSTVMLTWTASGDDGDEGAAVRYDLRFSDTEISAETWSAATGVSGLPAPQIAGSMESVTIDSLMADTIYYFALIAIDDGDNQSGLSNIVSDTTSISVDQIPPAAVADLTAAAVTDSTVTLTWTASGDDGDEGTAFRYDLRYSETELSAETWSAATRVSGLSAPQIAGSMESVTVDSLIADTIYYFALITLDDADNHSGLSNVASDTTSVSTDQIPPAAVTDLSAAAVTDSTVMLTWTASGDDGDEGAAVRYDLRFSDTEISAETWSAATGVSGLPAPQIAGSMESVTIDSLMADTIYYFALIAIDDGDNQSGLSNVASDTTSATLNPIMVVSVDLLDFETTLNSQEFSISNANNGLFSWVIESDAQWITIEPSSGETTAEVDVVSVSVERAGLAAGNHTGTLTITPDAGAPQAITVEIEVEVIPPLPPAPWMTLVASGSFAMGSPSAHHNVTLSRDFYLGKYEVTNFEFLAALRWAYRQGLVSVQSNSVNDVETGVRLLSVNYPNCQIEYDADSDEFSFIGDNPAYKPVSSVTWYGAVCYCDWLNQIFGHTAVYDHTSWTAYDNDPYGKEGYRLPTEAEWEYATQFEGPRAYPWGNEPKSCGRYNGWLYSMHWCRDDKTVVGSYPAAPEGLGLFDMAGNVFEYCSDVWVGELGSEDQIDPTGPTAGSKRPIRGGCYYFAALNYGCECYLREDVDLDWALHYVGFRLAQSRETADLVAPGVVTDLSVTDVQNDGVTLAWSAPGDNGYSGTASSYSIRFSQDEINTDTWDMATEVEDVPQPAAAGNEEYCQVNDLAANTQYYFALKTTDEVMNESIVSNVVVTTTASVTDQPVVGVSSQYLDFSGAYTRRQIEISNIGVGTLNWSAAAQQPWVQVEPANGSVTDGFSLVTITVDRASLIAGTHSTRVTFSAPEGSAVDVDLNVVIHENGYGIPAMVHVPSGSFTMGDIDAGDSAPEHEVTLTRDFHLGTFEIQNQEFLNALQWAFDTGYVTMSGDYVHDHLDGSDEMLIFLGDNYSEIQFDGVSNFSLRESPAEQALEAYPDGYDPASHPVKCVSWLAAVRYCDWLSMQEGLPRAYEHDGNWLCNGHDPYSAPGYRLPTEAEWEYSSRWNDGRMFPWGDEFDNNCSEANYSQWWVVNSHGWYGAPCIGWTTPVGSYSAAPGALGLFDMSGNSYELCNDYYDSLGSSSETDPAGPAGPVDSDYRVMRGGGWITSTDLGPEGLMCATRYRTIYFSVYPDNFGAIGFRICKTDY